MTQELVQAYGAGEAVNMVGEQYRSFDEFVIQRSPGFLRFARLVTGNEHDAADVVQDALVGLLPRWKRVAANGNPDAYVRRSIVNANRMRWRKYHREVTVEVFPERAAQQSAQQCVEDSIQAGEIFAALPVKQRAAVALRFYEDLSFAQVAEAIGCTEAAARTLVHRALKQLRTRFGGEQS